MDHYLLDQLRQDAGDLRPVFRIGQAPTLPGHVLLEANPQRRVRKEHASLTLEPLDPSKQPRALRFPAIEHPRVRGTKDIGISNSKGAISCFASPVARTLIVLKPLDLTVELTGQTV